MAGPKSGIFVVIEGSDGSGKTTQLNLLKERIKAVGFDVAVFDFPRYDHESSYFVRQYLLGNYGAATRLSPYTSSIFYALDRFEAAKDIAKALKDGKIVLSNRYVGSNMAHQGAKFEDPVEQRGFFVWEDNLEFELLGIPRPDMSFFLRVPVNTSLKLIKERATKTGAKLDNHEKNADFLKKSLETYDILCQLFPKDYQPVECTKDGELMSVTEISDSIWKKLKLILPPERPNPSRSTVVKLEEPPKSSFSAAEPPAAELKHSFRDASLMLRLLLQRNRDASISPSFPSWQESEFRYFMPQGLPKNIANHYRSTVRLLSDKYRQIDNKLSKYLASQPKSDKINSVKYTADLLKPLTPLCALTSFDLVIKKEELRPLIDDLLANGSDESQLAAYQLHQAAKQKWPHDFKQSMESDTESIGKVISKLSYNDFSRLGNADEDVLVVEASPKLEFDLLAESLYPHSDIPMEELARTIDNWSYSQKSIGLKEAAADQAALRQVRYRLDILANQLTLDEIIEKAEVLSLRAQPFTGRYGFDIPSIIESAGVDEVYAECFDESLKLFSLIQGAGCEYIAPYATLLGHKTRCQLTIDAAALRRVINQLDDGSHPLVASIAGCVNEVHPLLWDFLRSSATESHRGQKVKRAHRPPKQSAKGKK